MRSHGAQNESDNEDQHGFRTSRPAEPGQKHHVAGYLPGYTFQTQDCEYYEAGQYAVREFSISEAVSI